MSLYMARQYTAHQCAALIVATLNGGYIKREAWRKGARCRYEAGHTPCPHPIRHAYSSINIGERPLMYIPQSYQKRDKFGNAHNVWVMKDEHTKTYVAEIENHKGVIIGLGEAERPHTAADCAIDNLHSRGYVYQLE